MAAPSLGLSDVHLLIVHNVQTLEKILAAPLSTVNLARHNYVDQGSKIEATREQASVSRGV